MTVLVTRRSVRAAGIGAACLVVAGPASANGRFPASNQIVLSPTDPALIVARTTYGILPSHDNGVTWGFLCEDSLGVPSGAYQDPELGLTATNVLVAALYSPTAGLDVSDNGGCDWSCVGGPLANQGVADIVVRPEAPALVLALTSTYRPADAGGGSFSQVFQSVDNGAHWPALGVSLDPAALVQTIDVAASDPHRIYVSATRGFGPGRTASLFVSADDAAHWTERPVSQFDPSTEDAIYIGGVDPTDADRVYLRSSALPTGGQSRLFVTLDAGMSFRAAEQFSIPQSSALAITGEILGFALSPDGSKIYAGTKEQGLFVASRADMAFHQTSFIHVQCLATRGSELWACSDEVSGFVVGVSTDDGATFQPKLATITGLLGPIACSANAGGRLACGATTNGSRCADAFNLVCQSYSLDGRCTPDTAKDDGGAHAAGQGDAGGGRATAVPSGGCSATGHRAPEGFVAVGAIAVWAVRRTRKRTLPR